MNRIWNRRVLKSYRGFRVLVSAVFGIGSKIKDVDELAAFGFSDEIELLSSSLKVEMMIKNIE